ncbi:MAG: redox-regulated ATPase YchF [Nanoarchaeota archaeon]|nr:redox-regulated ATPase YchF [Nanoarchaeota archaeon]MBU1030706.1 redox-regulated ATPase YchF [Nanoarchaeota archaeon]MBU1849559.1 redox-regulated ATPase YchF [Nanoarchaeota archaeon]
MIIGVVGKANVGKSTFFKALTLADVEIANYPFATIKPNHGIGFVKVKCVDEELGVQCNPREGFCVNHKRFVPVDIIDVAGLVPGAHEGKGMGSQFLNDLNGADALIHVIDCSGSTNEKGEPVNKCSYDPAKDVEFLEEELDFWYFDILKKGWEKFARQIQQEQQDIVKALAKQLSGVGVSEDLCKKIINQLSLSGQPVSWSEKDLFNLASEFRKATKPMIIAANKIDVPGAEDNYKRLRETFPHLTIIPCSAESELALKEAAKHRLIEYISGEKDFKITGDLNEKQKQALEFIKENVLKKFVEGSGVQAIINNVIFGVLEYIAIFPGGINKLEDQYGNVLPDCFLIPKNSTALDFAYKIHSDLGDKFIRAIDVKTKMTVGKEHLLKHRDVIEIISGK